MFHITKLLLLLRFVSPFSVPKRSMMLLHRQSSSLREARDNNSAEQHHLLIQLVLTMTSWSMYKMNLHYRHRIVTIHQAAAALPMITNSQWTLEESPARGWIQDGVPVDVALNSLWMYHFQSLHHHHRRIMVVVVAVEIEKKKLWWHRHHEILQRV